ncbi:hypothetical protein LZ31DRAFT_482681 [Colletotrichum somersetense]|nr:hypothetical protein LZ31DRAFT_482681 [Colletotrichum somersetense]
MCLDIHLQVLFVPIAVLGAVACPFIKRFFICRQFARDHGCKPVTRSMSKDPFLGLDTIPESIRACRQHYIFKRNREFFTPENIKTVLLLKFKNYGIGHRLEAFKTLLGKGIFDTDGEH